MKKIGKRMLSLTLGLLGFGTTFVLMACYAPVPSDYHEVDELSEEYYESVDSVSGDSINQSELVAPDN